MTAKKPQPAYKKQVRRVLYIIYNVLFWGAFVFQIVASSRLLNRVKEDMDLFPWGELLGEDLMEMLLFWLVLLAASVLMYIFDSVGPCIFSKVTYIVVFVTPFVYPFIAGPGFLWENFNIELYARVVNILIIASYVLFFVDFVRWGIYLYRIYMEKTGKGKRKIKS